MNLTNWLREYSDRTAEPHAYSATDAAFDLFDLALSGEQWAVDAVRAELKDSLTKRIKSQRQAGHTTAVLLGKRRSEVKTMPAVPRVSVETGEQLGWSLADLWDMDETALRDLLTRQERERRQVGDRIAVTRALLTALAAHPECTTARCAWLAEGRSIGEIDLSA